MKPICPDCKGKVIRYRVRTKDYICHRCGKVFRADEIKSEKEPSKD
jgi:transcription initiation factor TFIIIB Brf1 subunit/transcription initiation factor TFIIB